MMSALLHNKLSRVLVIALVPFLGVVALVWSTTGRSDKIDRIPVAVVNNDQIVSGPQPMAAGRALAASLTQPKNPDQNLSWTLTDQADANLGLQDGTYYAVLTIPEDFSRSILSTGTDKPVQGKLSLVSNAAASVTVPYIGEQVTAAAADAVGVQSTQGYLKNVYAGFNQVASSNKQSASSAASLADGTDQLSHGATQLGNGSSSLASSLGQLQSGAASLHGGADSLATGAEGVRSGASGVADGASRLHAGAARLAASSRQLAASSGHLAAASRQVSHGAAALAGGSSRLVRANALISRELSALARVCDRVGRSGRPCTAVHRLAGQAQAAARGAALVNSGAAALAGSTRQLADGAGRLTHGNAEMSSAAGRLDGASTQLSSGADALLSGASSVASGANTLDQSAGSLATGAGQAASAGASLATGASSLSSSAAQVAGGAQQLSSGLAKGAQQSPTYSTSEQDALANVVSQPVLLSHSLQNNEHGNGWLLALVIGLVLWLTAMLGGLGRGPVVSGSHGELPVSSRRLVLVDLLPALGMAVLEAVAVLLGLLVMRVGSASVLPLAIVTVEAALGFTAVVFATRVLFGRAATFVLVLLVVVQVAALGNVVPLETAPALLRVLNHVLPLTSYVDGTSQLVSGGQVGSPVGMFLVLLVWLVGAALVAVLAVGRRRVLRGPPASRLVGGPAAA